MQRINQQIKEQRVKCHLGLLIFLFTFAPVFNSHAESKVETIDNLLLQWQQIEAQRSQIQQQWQLRQQILNQQLQLLDDEKSELSRLITEKGEASSDVDAEREKLLTQQSSLESQQTALSSSLQKAKSQVLAMFSQLPPVLQKSWQPHINHLNLQGSVASETLNHIVESLKKLHGFNDRIVLHQTVMSLDDGNKEKKIQVQQIYLGSARAWYISHDKKYWGKGSPTIDGWQWQPLQQDSNNQDLANTLSALVKSVEQPSKASWASLPIQFSSQVNNLEELK
jgi:hypothetical protein